MLLALGIAVLFLSSASKCATVEVAMHRLRSTNPPFLVTPAAGSSAHISCHERRSSYRRALITMVTGPFLFSHTFVTSVVLPFRCAPSLDHSIGHSHNKKHQSFFFAIVMATTSLLAARRHRHAAPLSFCCARARALPRGGGGGGGGRPQRGGEAAGASARPGRRGRARPGGSPARRPPPPPPAALAPGPSRR